jgi:hypothetical protein
MAAPGALKSRNCRQGMPVIPVACRGTSSMDRAGDEHRLPGHRDAEVFRLDQPADRPVPVMIQQRVSEPSAPGSGGAVMICAAAASQAGQTARPYRG